MPLTWDLNDAKITVAFTAHGVFAKDDGDNPGSFGFYARRRAPFPSTLPPALVNRQLPMGKATFHLVDDDLDVALVGMGRYREFKFALNAPFELERELSLYTEKLHHIYRRYATVPGKPLDFREVAVNLLPPQIENLAAIESPDDRITWPTRLILSPAFRDDLCVLGLPFLRKHGLLVRHKESSSPGVTGFFWHDVVDHWSFDGPKCTLDFGRSTPPAQGGLKIYREPPDPVK